MLIIGELINGMYKDVARAIEDKDKEIIKTLAKKQVDAGAGMLDVNTGPYSKDPKKDMRWLVETIQDAVKAGLVLDSTKPDVIEEGLKLVKEKPMINSTSADDEKLGVILPMAKKYKAMVIGLTMDKKGIPRDRSARVEHAAKIIASCDAQGIDLKDVYIDPIVLPVNIAQQQAVEVLESIKEFKAICDPQPKTVVGLSNISQGAKSRSLINTCYLVMAAAAGLTAAIADPLDKQLMDFAITGDLLLNKNIYCGSFLEAYRKKR